MVSAVYFALFLSLAHIMLCGIRNDTLSTVPKRRTTVADAQRRLYLDVAMEVRWIDQFHLILA